MVYLYMVTHTKTTACSGMFDLIGTVMADKLSVKLNNVKFVSLLFDG